MNNRTEKKSEEISTSSTNKPLTLSRRQRTYYIRLKQHVTRHTTEQESPSACSLCHI
jgi:hypothetical protein